MLRKYDFSETIVRKDDLAIRKITEEDRDSFSAYTSISHFQETLSSTDTLGLFIQNEMVGAIVS